MSKRAKHLELPPLEVLDDLLVYLKDSGDFYWRHRPIEYFNDTAMKSKEQAQEWWNSRYAGKVAGSVKNTGYKNIKIFGQLYYVHRLAYLMSTGVDPLSMQIDHINQDRLDNRFSNLRLVTHAENGKNQSMSSTNTSGITGITAYRHKPDCWVGQVVVDGKNLNITNPRTGKGYFEDFERPTLERMIAEKYRELGFHNNHGSLN